MLDLRYRTILSVAIPLMGSSFVQSIVMLTDASFLSRYSTIAFDASGNGGLLYITLFVVLMGFGDGSQILMARRIGEKKENLLAQIFGTTLLANTMIALLLFLLVQFTFPALIDSFTHNKAIAVAEAQFVQIRSFGLFFAVISLAIIAYFTAMGKTLIVLTSAAITAFSNIGLDYLLIFGKGGFPELGLKGAAWASTISDGLSALFLLIFLTFSAYRKKHEMFAKLRFNKDSFVSIFKVGSPIAFQGVVALISWTVFFIWIEQRGTFELTVSQNVRALYFLAFIPIWGFAGTTKTYISQYMGSRSFKEIGMIQRRIFVLTTLFLILFFHGALFYPEKLISIINPKAEYLESSAEILRFIFGSTLIYGMTSVFFQTINGSGNTRFTFYIELISVIIYIGSAYLLIKVFNVSLYWIWSVEYIYFICMGGLSIAYLYFFKWQQKII